MKKCNIVNYANSLLYWLHDIILVEIIIKGRREIARIDCCISFYFPSAFPSHQTHLKRDRKTDWMINRSYHKNPRKRYFDRGQRVMFEPGVLPVSWKANDF